MRNYSRDAAFVKGELEKYCLKICSNLGRVATRLVINMLFGIAKANSCLLTDIGRAL